MTAPELLDVPRVDDTDSNTDALDTPDAPEWDALRVAAELQALPTGSVELDRRWDELTPEQVAQLNALHLTRPYSLPDESGFRRDPNADARMLRAEVEAGMRRVRRGLLSVDAATYERLTELADRADRTPNDSAGDDLERAAFILRRAAAAAFEAVPFTPTRTTARTLPRGETEILETDSLGRERSTRYSQAERDAAAADHQGDAEALPNDPMKVSLETMADWSMPRKLAFRDANPERWEQLLQDEGELRDEMHRRAGWVH